MKTPDIEKAVEGLIQSTLNAGAPDNVTVVIAEAVGAEEVAQMTLTGRG